MDATTSLDLERALNLAYACELSYTHIAPHSRARRVRMVHSVQALGDDRVSGYVARLRSNDDLIVVIRGSERLRDWITNIKFGQFTYAAGHYTGKVHRGFADLAESLWPMLNDCIRSRRRGNENVTVTGHSLGGALALLVAARLAYTSIPVAGTYTFGAPRVGNKDFVRTFKPAHLRFEHGNDLIPHLPLTPVLGGIYHPEYFHSGELCYLPRGRRRIISHYSGIRGVVADSLRVGKVMLGAGRIRDHDMHRYADYLEHLLGMQCPHCRSAEFVNKNGTTRTARRRFTCTQCGAGWSSATAAARSGTPTSAEKELAHPTRR